MKEKTSQEIINYIELGLLLPIKKLSEIMPSSSSNLLILTLEDLVKGIKGEI